ncbi:MAG TPA: nucleotidyltransferase family protein [Solirubrobacteraceae bacterium]|jgi:molybdenum cofactor cytidylyltransferase
MDRGKRRVSAIVLAAGGSTRMGRPKLALPFSGGSVLSAVLDPLLRTPLASIVVVLGNAADEVRGSVSADDARLRFVVNPSWAEGMASSLGVGLREALDSEAVLVALGDKVGMTRPLIERLLAALERGPLVVPELAGRGSHPVLFSWRFYPELLALRGDVGARDVVRRHRDQVVFVPGEPLHDVDDAADYERLLAGRPPRDDDGMVLAEK